MEGHPDAQHGHGRVLMRIIGVERAKQCAVVSVGVSEREWRAFLRLAATGVGDPQR